MKNLARTAGALVIALFLAMPMATPLAAMVLPSPEFGAHVREMSKQMPGLGGRLLGECVSTMATGQDCPHHPDA